MSIPNAVASSSKKVQSKHKVVDGAHQSGHKKETKSTGKKEKSGPFEHRLSRMRLSVAPKYSADWLVGVREVLDGMLMRYVAQMSGVLLAHWEHEFLDDTVKIVNECPFGICEVQFRSVIWAPRLGQRLYGTHSLSSPSHLSLLFSKTFNVSIPLQHIPLELYRFEHGEGADDLSDDSEDEDGADGPVRQVGRWKSKRKGKLLGEGGKGTKFTVIGLQVTNQMLSLTGSLLADPTNPPVPPESPEPVQHASPSLSPEPMNVEPPMAQPRYENTRRATGPVTYDAELQPQPEAAIEHEVMDERFLSARELKKRRKDEKREKRDERTVKKNEKVLEAVEAAGGGDMVGMKGIAPDAVGKKRKANGDIAKIHPKKTKGEV